MVTDSQVRKLMKLIKEEKTLAVAASKAGMDEKTARKYRDLGKMPSQIKEDHTWRTREDPFSGVWESVGEKLSINPGLQAKTLFEDLQRQYPGGFDDGQLRTLQRRVKAWRALEGPGKEVFFAQKHRPGKLCQSDFTSMNRLGVTISGQPFDHLIYHFVLTYSNWEAGTVCFSESFESLSQGLQNALWELGGIPLAHQTDRMSAAVHKTDNPEEFTNRYKALLSHYGLEGKKIQTGKPNENGDVEQRHYRFKTAVDQALMLRGEGKHRINYRHIIRWLLRKPGAFANYRYREDLFPTHRFRMAYDWLKRNRPATADKEYLRILKVSAHEGEALTDQAILCLFNQDHAVTAEAVKEVILSGNQPGRVTDVSISDVDLMAYDGLLKGTEAAPW